MVLQNYDFEIKMANQSFILKIFKNPRHFREPRVQPKGQ